MHVFRALPNNMVAKHFSMVGTVLFEITRITGLFARRTGFYRLNGPEVRRTNECTIPKMYYIKK